MRLINNVPILSVTINTKRVDAIVSVRGSMAYDLVMDDIIAKIRLSSYCFIEHVLFIPTAINTSFKRYLEAFSKGSRLPADFHGVS